MSYVRHKGIVCDNCGSTNFMGLRYKCLICIDYDLCSACQEKGVRVATHLSTHPTQCIITSALKELFFGGEDTKSVELPPQSFTCPHCGKPGFSLGTLLEHVGKKHLVANTEVLCPICVCEESAQDWEVESTTDNLALHLVLKHGTLNTHLKDVQSLSSSSENSSMSPTPIGQETPIEPMVRIISQNFSDMRMLALHEARSHDMDQAESMLIVRRQLEQRRASRAGHNETCFSRNLLPSLSMGSKGANVFKPLFSIKKRIDRFKRQSETITEHSVSKAEDVKDFAGNFLLPALQRSEEPSTSKLKANLCELWYRAEFVQELLMSMLAMNDLRRTASEAYPSKWYNRDRTQRLSARNFGARLEPCIHEDSDEDDDIESTDL